MATVTAEFSPEIDELVIEGRATVAVTERPHQLREPAAVG